MPAVNPKILTWARETADYSLEDAARKIELKAAKGKTGAERLRAMEQGEDQPSRPLLLRMSKKYRRSLLVFYLDKPPQQGNRGDDFRTVLGAEPPEYNPTLDTLIRDINTRHSLVKSLLEDEESKPVSFIGSTNMDQDYNAVASSIMESIDFNLNDFRNQRTVSDAFAYLRFKIEAAGVFVLLIGNLGSYHTNLSADVFRGFAIADSIAPFIVINDQDARQAWSFTALHEVAHLWLGVTGISGASLDAQIEKFCNEIAACILLPIEELELLADISTFSFKDAVDSISEFASIRKISRAMVAYSLFRTNSINLKSWIQYRDYFFQEWAESKLQKRDRYQAEEGGPSYYVIRRHRLGDSLLSLTNRSLNEGHLTYTKAGQILGVKPRNVEPLLRD